MNEFSELLSIADRLLGPNGCPWDRAQTLFTLQPYLLEEAHELIEAIDSGDPQKIADELGDVLFALVFIAKLGEINQIFDMKQALNLVSEKLIRRHPHIFGELKNLTNEQIAENWDQIKKKEKTHEHRQGLFDGIPATLPALPKAQKMAKKLQKKTGQKPEKEGLTEEVLGEKLWNLINQGVAEEIDAESALRRHLNRINQMH